MWLNELWKRWIGRTSRQVRRQRRHLQARMRARLYLEALEDRTLPSGGGVATTGALITAIQNANTAGGATTITLAEGATFDFTKANNSTNGSNALPVINVNNNNNTITIIGNGDTLERTGTTPFRLLDVAKDGSLTLENLTLTGGLTKGTGAAAEGGAIYSSGTLKLDGAIVKGNSAAGSNAANGAGGAGASAYGGGLYVAAGTVSLTDDFLTGNSAQGGLGGTQAGSNGGNGGNGGNGMGGSLYVNSGSVTLINDTFSSNLARGNQGGQGGQGDVGNPGRNGAPGITGGPDSPGGQGGTGGHGGSGGNGLGGSLYINSGSVTLTNDTLYNDRALGGQGGSGGQGGRGGSGGNGGNGSKGGRTNNHSSIGGTGGHGGQGGTGGNGGIGGRGAGGSLYVNSGSVTLTNDTLSNNNVQGGLGGRGGLGGLGGPGGPGGIGHTLFGQQRTASNGSPGGPGSGGDGGSGGNGIGGGLYLATGSTATLANTLIAQNAAEGNSGGFGGLGVNGIGATGAAGTASGPDVSGNAASSDHDLIGDGTGFSATTSKGDLIGTSSSPINPLLGSLANNGGPTETLALLPGSPAIAAGDTNAANLPSTDQRGMARTVNGNVDIGAYQAQGFALSVTSGNNQSAQPNAAFADPLVVTVTAKDGVDPVAGGQIAFTAPSSGASAALSPANPLTIAANGTASVKATANGTNGSYSVTANMSGAASPATFSLTNGPMAPTVSVTDAGGTYNGNPFAATGKAVNADGQAVSGSFTYAYYAGSSATGTSSSTAPSNAGTYTVVASFTSSDPDYGNGTAQTTFTINPLAVTLSGSRSYDGTTTAAASILSITNLVGSVLSVSVQNLVTTCSPV